ncbi:MAG: adenylyltransferase/cytidyltransferase family protein [Candidatus Aminicenantes bacterium]|nr:adenylyltransferase/cytidyltransferase family protein [Candidatus Aminicenantes bacterium]
MTQSTTRRKIKSPQALLPIRARLRRQGQTVVFTNGCFDLIHGGHIHLFRWAKSKGDILVVALNSDASVRRLAKGPGRPIFPLAERMEVLAALADVDYVTWFGEATPRKIIAALLPDVLVKGGDWGEGEIVGRAEVEAAGGKVLRVPYLKGHSSTNIIETILKNFS